MEYESFSKHYTEMFEWESEAFPLSLSPASKTNNNSMVNHPQHYTAGNVEVIDIIEDAVSSAPDIVLGGLQWQVLKYLLRMWLKENPKQDAEKAQWYLTRLIDKLEITK